MAPDSAIRSFTFDVDELGWTGHDLQRPESVVAEADGTLWPCRTTCWPGAGQNLQFPTLQVSSTSIAGAKRLRLMGSPGFTRPPSGQQDLNDRA